MLPLLFFELTWKTIWMVAIGVPRWLADTLTPDIQASLFDCGIGLVIFPLVIPWGYVVEHYVRRPADRWNGTARHVGTGSDLDPERVAG
jgi:hypothetical protein